MIVEDTHFYGRICVVGLGYVGLPLARLFSTRYNTIGYDIDAARVRTLMSGKDETLEVEDDLLQQAIENGFVCTTDLDEIRDCNIYIVTVPTPVYGNNTPDLTPLQSASRMVGKVIGRGDIVIYESTVFPGATEQNCIPEIEQVSGLKYNVDFFAGYSPERINPGDKVNTIDRIVKITSGSTPEVADKVDELYRSVIPAGTYKASSIRVAEAAKVVENSQRDINIAFVNELSRIFSRMGIDTNDVLDAAATKWNFIRMRPGLVGGHCIGVDPYYLIDKAKSNGYNPTLMIAARRMNDELPDFIVNQVIRLMNLKGVIVKGARILILGYTFKENCPDMRNTKVKDLVEGFLPFTRNIDVYEPWVESLPVPVNHLTSLDGKSDYDCIILAVAHDQFLELQIPEYLSENGVIYDIKGLLPQSIVSGRL